MRFQILTVLMVVLALSQAKPIFVNEQSISVTPGDVEDWIVAFLDGFEVNKYANASAECRADGGVFYELAAAGVENYAHHHYLEGTYNISDALGELSPISRICYDTEVQLMNAFDKYWSQFHGFTDFVSKVSINAMSNVKPIKIKGTLILTELLTTKNYTNISFLGGQIASLVFAFQDSEALWSSGNLHYTETDPLSPDPINHIMWIIFEGLYKFGLNSKAVTEASLKNCNEGLLNMVLLDEKAYKLYKKGDTKEAWFAFTDSLTFSHQIVDGCYHSYKEAVATMKKVKEQVIDQGKLFSNILSNFFFIISSIFSSWSQIYYKDWLNLLGALGSLTFRVFVSGTH